MSPGRPMDIEPLIELGELAEPPAIELGELQAEPAAPDRPRRPRMPRWLPVLAAGVVVLLGVGGSAVPRPGLVPVATLPYAVGAVSAIGSDTVFIDRHGMVDAYDLASGARRWSVPASGSSEGMLVAESAGVLLVNLSDPPGG
ncbi:MAG: hypothetical protein J2P15_16980, partial [Micromonosporaceae bacterium]|nr:hypothetical protein [Micromonosporaceae bacterium]